jgi:hypothetical protein
VSTVAAKKASTRSFGAFADEEEEESETVTEGVAAAINEKLTKIALPQLSRQEQIHLADIVECVAVVEKQRRSMDDNAADSCSFSVSIFYAEVDLKRSICRGERSTSRITATAKIFWLIWSRISSMARCYGSMRERVVCLCG